MLFVFFLIQVFTVECSNQFIRKIRPYLCTFLDTRSPVKIAKQFKFCHHFATILVSIPQHRVIQPDTKVKFRPKQDSTKSYLVALGGTEAFKLRNRGSWVRIPLGAPAH